MAGLSPSVSAGGDERNDDPSGQITLLQDCVCQSIELLHGNDPAFDRNQKQGHFLYGDYKKDT